ncbi:MAG: NTP transferase domain-containing protein [Candidatus Eremiobacteraeota bacterium]|nr:NTP transferase domain-containing protein [Candidatus Eremiobacteraeota bacterium]MBV8374954.1 NTP transferase domain-containing protein [Candidatus Eremiobacteraeota bacterium]
MTTDAIVLAGGPVDAVALLAPGAPNKSFVQIGGRPMIARVLSALREAPSVGRVVVVAPPAFRDHSALALADELRADGKRITDSLRNGLEGFAPERDVLIVASDLPVLNGLATEDFIAGVNARDADLVYGCVEKQVHLAHFPDVPHTWARLRDGTFCGGGIAAIKPRAFALLERFLERLGAARKRPLRLASLFGWDVAVRFALGRLTVEQAEARASEILGAPVRALVSSFPETAVNVDRPGDVAIAERLVRGLPHAAGPV